MTPTGTRPLGLSADRDNLMEVRVPAQPIVEQFAQHQAYRGLSARTITRRTGTLEQFARFIAPLQIIRATRQHIEQFLATKIEARTRHAYRSDLRMFFAWAHDAGLVEIDPAVRLASIRVPRTLPRPISREAAIQMLWSGSLKVRRMVGLAMFAGLRVFEIAQLDASDVWVGARPPVVVVRNGKGGKDRSVPMHPLLVELMHGLPSAGPVFRGRMGANMLAHSVGVAIRNHMRRCGIDGTPHQLRATFGTELASVSGGDMVLTADLMGHSSMSTTMGYVRLVRSDESGVVSRMFDDDEEEVA